jgi:hypothetical protein
MDFSHSDTVRGLQQRLHAFMGWHVCPAAASCREETEDFSLAARSDPLKVPQSRAQADCAAAAA